jgi:hypothetical protein
MSNIEFNNARNLATSYNSINNSSEGRNYSISMQKKPDSNRALGAELITSTVASLVSGAWRNVLHNSSGGGVTMTPDCPTFGYVPAQFMNCEIRR